MNSFNNSQYRSMCNWICKHGAAKALSADDAYDKKSVYRIFTSHGIIYQPRSSRIHNKLGIVERKNQTIKNIIRKLDTDHHEATAETTITRANFLSYTFLGSKILSSF